MATAVTIDPPPPWLDLGAARDLRDRLVGHDDIADHREQQNRVRARLGGRGIDTLMTFKPAAIDYLTGYATTSPGKIGLALTSSGVRLRAAQSELGRALLAPGVTAIDIYGWDGPMDIHGWMKAVIATHGVSAIGVELGEATTPPIVVDVLHDLDVEIVDVTGLIDSVRLYVSQRELVHIRRAADVTAIGLEAAVAHARGSDVRDSTVAAAIMSSMMRASDSLARSNITVGVDEQGGIPHSPWNGKPFVHGSVMFVEFSGAARRYCAPVMRTFVNGKASKRVLRLYDMVHEMLEIVLGHLRAGATCATIARAATHVLEDASDVLFHHNFGYPVGLSDHGTWMNGAPFHITTDNDGTLEEDMVFHLPIVLRHFGDVAVGESQTVRITDNGVEILTAHVQPSGLIEV